MFWMRVPLSRICSWWLSLSADSHRAHVPTAHFGLISNKQLIHAVVISPIVKLLHRRNEEIFTLDSKPSFIARRATDGLHSDKLSQRCAIKCVCKYPNESINGKRPICGGQWTMNVRKVIITLSDVGICVTNGEWVCTMPCEQASAWRSVHR